MSTDHSFGFVLVQERLFAGRKPRAATAATGEIAGFVGCYMMTDERGYPKEFRITTPVKPTAVQRAIYGDALDSYVSQELIAETLLRDASSAPELLLVDSPALASFEPRLGMPVVTLEAEADVLFADNDTDQPSLVMSTIGSLSYRVAEQHERQARIALETCVTYFDPLKAFERMSNALDVLVNEDERFD